jgi:hypothetical protein
MFGVFTPDVCHIHVSYDKLALAFPFYDMEFVILLFFTGLFPHCYAESASRRTYVK